MLAHLACMPASRCCRTGSTPTFDVVSHFLHLFTHHSISLFFPHSLTPLTLHTPLRLQWSIQRPFPFPFNPTVFQLSFPSTSTSKGRQTRTLRPTWFRWCRTRPFRDTFAKRARAMGADQALQEATTNVKRGAFEMKRALVRPRRRKEGKRDVGRSTSATCAMEG